VTTIRPAEILVEPAYDRGSDRTEGTATAMDLQQRVQVVLGEAERTDGLLRFVLEGEGFDIIGLASDDQELMRVLRGARPAVIVLDGGISATAALEARRISPRSILVVVWPDGVSAVVAEEHVEPDLVISDLGDAVRRAGRRAELRKPPTPMPELLRRATTDRPVQAPVRNAPVRTTVPKQTRTGRRGLLVAAATWMLVITALATIAAAVPKAFDRSPAERAPRRTPSGPVDQRPVETTTVPERTGDVGKSDTCDTPAAPSDRADRSADLGSSDRVRGKGCSPDRERVAARAKATGPAVETIPRGEPAAEGAAGSTTTLPPAVTAVGDQLGDQLDEALDSDLTGSVQASVVPTPGPDEISSSPSSAASLSAMPWSPLP
jgi:hypothetical protein